MVAHLPALRRYALGLSGTMPAADDLVQDCIERALRRVETLQGEDKLAGWLRAILFNLFIDGRRQVRQRGESVQLDLVKDSFANATPPDCRHEAQDVLLATACLTPEHRQVLLLIGVEGLTYREASHEIGVPLGTVMSRLARARDQLRTALDRGVPAPCPVPLEHRP